MKDNPGFTVQKESTLLPFLLTCFPNKSRNHVKGLLTRGQVAVNGVVRTHHAHALHPGDQVTVRAVVPAAEPAMSIPVLYEDDDIIVVDKPVGMLSISTDRERERTAYHIVTDYVKRRSASGRVFVVHRLDRETSGVMLLAKNERIKHALQDNWDESVTHRGYTAVVEGRVERPEGTVTSWLRQTKTLLVYSSGTQGDGKLAITHYRTTQTADDYSLLDVMLETGRKNQVRVHMKDIGHPIAGDKKYGAKTNPLARLGLHAHLLVLRHPETGEEMRFTSRVPKVFMSVFQRKET